MSLLTSRLSDLAGNYFNLANVCEQGLCERSCGTEKVSSDLNIPVSKYIDPCDLRQIKSSSDFIIATYNCQGLETAFDTLLTTVNESNLCFDVISLTETFLSEISPLSLYSLGGYSFYYKNRTQMRKGGLGIYVRNDISVTVEDTLGVWVEGRFESFVVNVKKYDVEILIAIIYRTPSSNPTETSQHFENLCQNLGSCKKPCVLMGDFNHNLLELGNNMNAEFLTTMLSFSFFPSINIPTRITQHTATLIDNILISEDICDRLKSSNVLIAPGSDHLLAFVTVSFSDLSSYPNDQHKIEEKIFVFNEPNLNKLKDHLRKLEWSDFLSQMTMM